MESIKKIVKAATELHPGLWMVVIGVAMLVTVIATAGVDW